MSKKNFKGGLDSLLGNTPQPPKRGRPQTKEKIVTKTTQEGTKENETRATFIVVEDTLEKLKAIAYWDRVMIKEVMNTALLDYISKYEKKYGSVKGVPKK